MTDLLIGIDDTDVDGTPGTGRLARELAEVLTGDGAVVHGITRHQHWRYPSVPYTARNSSACLRVTWSSESSDVADAVETFLRAHFVEGADPALAVGQKGSVPPALIELGRWTKHEFVTVGAAEEAAGAGGLEVRSVAGRRHGVVGAIAAVALRAAGDDGRFVELAGIRLDWAEPTVAELLERTGITRVEDDRGGTVPPGDRINVNGWLRPSLRYGEPTLIVARSATTDGWENIEGRGHARRHRH